MELITFNIEGFHRNCFYLTQLLTRHSPKLLFLQEIWVPYSSEQSLNEIFADYSLQICTPDQFTNPEDRLSNPDHTWHGAAVMWHKSLNSNILCLSNTNDRFTGVKIVMEGYQVLAISLYLPTSGKDEEFLDCIAELSIFIADNKPDTGTVLIGTDSNCSERSSARRIHALHQFCEEHSLLKVCFSGPTFHHSNGCSVSNIDYFLVSCMSESNLKSVSIQCKLNFPENLSSHDPVFSTLAIPCTGQACREEKYSHTYSEFKQARLCWKEENLPHYKALA